MKLFFENHARSNRDHVITQIDKLLYSKYKSSFITSADLDSRTVNYIAFVHLNNDTDFLVWKERATNNPACLFVFCSSVPSELLGTLRRLEIPISNNIHAMTCDPEFFKANRLDIFANGAVIHNRPDFSLLNKSRLPEYLLGYKLLMAAGVETQLSNYLATYKQEILLDVAELTGTQIGCLNFVDLQASQVDAALRKYCS